MIGRIADLGYALRQLPKNSMLTGFATTLALSMGAPPVLFSVRNLVLLEPLRYRQPQQLDVGREIGPQLSQAFLSLPANLAGFRIWQRERRSFDDGQSLSPKA